MNTQDGSQTEVVLRDFDGSRTIFETDLPLRDVISAAQSDMVVTVNKTYIRTAETDERGRVIYQESH
ncbi:MAG TPA: hypothetical protein VMG40_15510 [Bryobacteraceae bacterium]|nr:hypothetical protein [Bryobacteraceae bacterium]